MSNGNAISNVVAIVFMTAIIVEGHDTFVRVHPLRRALLQYLTSTQSTRKSLCHVDSHWFHCGNNLNPSSNLKGLDGLVKFRVKVLHTQLSHHHNLKINVFKLPVRCHVPVPLEPDHRQYIWIGPIPRRKNNNLVPQTSDNALASCINNLQQESPNVTANSRHKPNKLIKSKYQQTKDEASTSTVTNDHKHPTTTKFVTPTPSGVLLPQSTASGMLVKNESIFELFKETLDRLERKFFLSVYTKLTAISPANRRENGISFLQSGLFLYLLLVTLSTEVDQNVTREIEDCLDLNSSEEDKIEMLRQIVSWLPESSNDLKFRWSSRLVLGRSLRVNHVFRRSASAMNLTLSFLNGTETPNEITKTLNEMVEEDSGAAMHETFAEEELSDGSCVVALATLYVRGRWRAAPTLLNDSVPFRDTTAAPPRTTRLFRVNDIVGYADLQHLDAEAVEIPYATPGLSLLIVVPKQPSLGKLVEQVARSGLRPLVAAMRQLRAAVTLPLYTLRMTLLLPNKLQHLGIPSVVNANNTDCKSLKLSHGVQSLMFWAEAGRNAYKDDGIEWDPQPDIELLVDRPYLFFVRWNNVTLMNGNFVL